MPGLDFDLPWPWEGARFALNSVPALTYVTGQRGSGKTRLVLALAAALPGAVFLDPERTAARAALDADPGLAGRAEAVMADLAAQGAAAGEALSLLLAALIAAEEAGAPLVVDLVEQGLDGASQGAVMAHLRRRGAGATPVVLLTRSSRVLDLAQVGAEDAILYCPADHSPPIRVAPVVGAKGYEALVGCLGEARGGRLEG